MKKVFISADIEGIWGNSMPAYTVAGGREYEEYRTNMINETNLLIDTLFRHGVEEVVVNDSHGNMDNLLPSRLDPRASFISSNGAYKEYGMMEGLDESFDGVCLIGYHCRSNSDGVMAHTIWGTMVNHICVDGEEMGESGINARLAWEYGVPVVLVGGDHLLKEQLENELVHPFAFVETKKAINAQCALCCSWNQLKQRYEEAVKETLAFSKIEPVTCAHTIDITFHHARNASYVSRMDGVEQLDNCTVRIQKDTYKELFRYLRFVLLVCNNFSK